MNSQLTDVDIVIIGGGIAGISALSYLKQNDNENRLKIKLIEAKNRLGGRIHSIKEDECFHELGASWLHGIHDIENTTEISLHSLVKDYLKISNNLKTTNLDKVIMFDFESKKKISYSYYK